MSSEPEEEPKDRTMWWWLGVLVLFAVLVAALWAAGRKNADITQVHAKHILVKCNKNDPVDRARAYELITELRKRVGNGESFSKLAKEFSDDEFSSARGGDLGYYPRGKFEPEFEGYVWSAPIGQLSDIIQTSHGFHLIVVLDRHVSSADQYEMELGRKVVLEQGGGKTPSPPSDSR